MTSWWLEGISISALRGLVFFHRPLGLLLSGHGRPTSAICFPSGCEAADIRGTSAVPQQRPERTPKHVDFPEWETDLLGLHGREELTWKPQRLARSVQALESFQPECPRAVGWIAKCNGQQLYQVPT